MPRIARRENPYESPARQQRHFKTQRDKVLRYLEEVCPSFVVFFLAEGVLAELALASGCVYQQQSLRCNVC